MKAPHSATYQDNYANAAMTARTRPNMDRDQQRNRNPAELSSCPPSAPPPPPLNPPTCGSTSSPPAEKRASASRDRGIPSLLPRAHRQRPAGQSGGQFRDPQRRIPAGWIAKLLLHLPQVVHRTEWDPRAGVQNGTAQRIGSLHRRRRHLRLLRTEAGGRSTAAEI
ncbi:GD20956 [Drosophila simulans]|uniref:GD20956 n=1 Tax=Drosophila simulans TaxID=7240 RepID=B4R026_DROSI|nr:GD20956 [Drosophila simulans]